MLKSFLIPKRFDKTLLIFFLILLLAAFLRFWRLSEMANFDFDQEYASNFAYSVLREFPIQLIGQGLSIQGLFMGPAYFYYLVPFFAVSQLHPVGGFVGSAIFGLAIISAYFLVGKELFGKTAGLIAASLRSILYVELNNDWNMAPVYGSELMVLLTWWCFYKYWKGRSKFIIVLGFLFGLYTSIHPILFPFYLVFLLLLLVSKILPNIKIAFLSILAFLIPISPLLIFEYFHKFLEVRVLISLFTRSPTEPANLGRLKYFLEVIQSEPQRVLGLQILPKELFLVSFAVILAFLIIRKVGFWQDSFHKVMVFITFGVFIIYYTFFPGHVPEYYFLALTCLIILYIAAILSFLTKNKILFLVLVLILLNITVRNLQQLVSLKWNNSRLITLYHKDVIVKEIVKSQPMGQEFYVSYISNLGWNFGFSYLFKLYGQIPQTKEVKPPIYTIVIPISLSPGSSDVVSGDIGLILPE